METYLLINLAIISFPLAATFYPRIGYFRRIPAVLVSMLSVGIFFVVWDVLATARGDWSFNSAHVLGLRFFGLPFEELLFFVTVPYSCFFVYESLRAYFKDSEVRFDRRLYLAAAAVMLAAAALNVGRAYTSTVLAVSGLFLFYAAFKLEKMLSSRFYWIYMGLTLFLFVIFNLILTSIPVVSYGPAAIWGVRFLSIPLEDFFYNYSMLSMHLAVYLWAGEKDLFQ